jgi:hypothetical protein
VDSDTCIHTKFYEDWFGHSSDIKVITSIILVATIFMLLIGRDSWCLSLRWPQASWCTYQVSWLSLQEFEIYLNALMLGRLGTFMIGRLNSVGFEVLLVVTAKSTTFWVVQPRTSERDRRFGRCLHRQVRRLRQGRRQALTYWCNNLSLVASKNYLPAPRHPGYAVA